MTGGNRPSGPPNKDTTNEMEMSAETCASQIPFTLSQCGVPTLGKVQCCMICALRCASARIQVGVVSAPPAALTAVATG